MKATRLSIWDHVPFFLLSWFWWLACKDQHVSWLREVWISDSTPYCFKMLLAIPSCIGVVFFYLGVMVRMSIQMKNNARRDSRLIVVVREFRGYGSIHDGE